MGLLFPYNDTKSVSRLGSGTAALLDRQSGICHGHWYVSLLSKDKIHLISRTQSKTSSALHPKAVINLENIFFSISHANLVLSVKKWPERCLWTGRVKPNHLTGISVKRSKTCRQIQYQFHPTRQWCYKHCRPIWQVNLPESPYLTGMVC